MVWPRKPPSTPPPQPASTGPEMERPLPTTTSKNNRYSFIDMFRGAGGATQAAAVPTPDPPVEDRGSPQVVPDGLPAASTDTKDADKVQAVGSETEALPGSEVTSRKDVGGGSDGSTTPEVDLTSNKDVGDNSNSSTSPVVNLPRSKKAKTVQRKAKYSLPRLLVIGACVSYMFVQVWGLTLGLHFVNEYASARVCQAESAMGVASEDLAIERTMYMHLDQLSKTELQWQYMESYQHCLVRGLFTAKKSFPVYPFDMHPDVRNQTLDWISKNCDKLFFTPQVHPSNMSLLRKVAEDARRVAKDALSLVKYRVLLLRRRFRGTKVTGHATTANHPFRIFEEWPITRESARLLSSFRLDCDESTRCHLVFSGKDFRWSKVAGADFANANKEISKWSFPFKKYLRISRVLLSALYFLQAYLLICSAIALHLSLPQLQSPPGQSIKRILAELKLRIRQLFDHREMSANIDLFWVGGVMCMPLRWRSFSDSLTSCNMLLPVGLIMIAIFPVGCSLAFFFPIPGSKRNARSFYRASKELWKILQGDEAFLDSLSKKGTKGASTTPKASPATKPALKTETHHISPATSLAEDLQQARKTLHAERDQTSDDETEDTSSSDEVDDTSSSSSDSEHTPASETVSDFDSDTDSAASYVDLTGGATPAISDKGSEHGEEWAVVQDQMVGGSFRRT